MTGLAFQLTPVKAMRAISFWKMAMSQRDKLRSVSCVRIGVRESAELCLIHRSQDIPINWGELRFFNSEGRIEVLDVQNVPL